MLIIDCSTEEGLQKVEEDKEHPELPSRKPGMVVGAPERQLEEGSGEITNKLDKVVGQLNIITKTLHILEQRMRVTEEQVSHLLDKENEQKIQQLPAHEENRDPVANPLIDAEREDIGRSNEANEEPINAAIREKEIPDADILDVQPSNPDQ